MVLRGVLSGRPAGGVIVASLVGAGNTTNLLKTPAVEQTLGVTREQHEHVQGHRGALVWLTGLPGSGKTTLAYGVEARLHVAGYRCAVLDGDHLRLGLSSDLGFSLKDRNENVRRTGEVARLLLALGTVVLVALVSPVRSARERLRQNMQEQGQGEDFIEVYCRCPLAICTERDPKGMYQRAGQGLISNFTGVSSPYEAPLLPQLTLETGHDSAVQCINRLTALIIERDAASLSTDTGSY